MDIRDLLAMYVGRVIKLIYRDKSCVVGLLQMSNSSFYVGKVLVDPDNVYGWEYTATL